MNCEEFIDNCKKHLGKPYIWNKDGPDCFDCSGFVQYVFKRLKLDPPGDQTAMDLYRYFKGSEKGVIVATPECGCLVFYGEPDHIKHVAVCIDQKKYDRSRGRR